MILQYLEIVTSDTDATCNALAQVHGVNFGEPDALVGNARRADLEGGGMIGVRAPLAEQDMRIVRPYMLVQDIDAAVQAAEAAGGEIAMGATEVPGSGKFAIYFLAGTQFGLWETSSADVGSHGSAKEQTMLVQYLEVVTDEVDATCKVLADVHGITFSEPDAGLGNARLAALAGGGRIGVRAPLAEQDMKIVRPYALVEDIQVAVEAAGAAGGEIAMGATEIPSGGKFAIYFLAGTQFGLWETTSSK